MDKYREEFEKEMQKFGFGEYENDFKINEETGEYIIQDLNAMLAGFKIGWKASCESMKQYYKQHLAYDDTYTSGYKTGFNDAIDATDKNLNGNPNLIWLMDLINTNRG